MDTILIAFIVKFIDPIQFVVAALVVWFAFRDNTCVLTTMERLNCSISPLGRHFPETCTTDHPLLAGSCLSFR